MSLKGTLIEQAAKRIFDLEDPFSIPIIPDYVKFISKSSRNIIQHLKKYFSIPLLIAGILLCFDPVMTGQSFFGFALFGNYEGLCLIPFQQIQNP
jgi:hypothetical protein